LFEVEKDRHQSASQAGAEMKKKGGKPLDKIGSVGEKRPESR